MPERLGEAVLELRTDDQRYEKGLKRAHGAAQGLDQRFQKLGRSAVRLGRNLSIGLGAAAGGLSLLFKRAVDTADDVAKTADRIGLGTDALQELRFAADQTGVNIQQLQQALTALIRRQGEAIAGNKEFADGFRRVGISVEELRRLTPEQLIQRVADGLSRIESQALRVAAADRIMSEAGRQIINVFDGGSKSLDHFAAKARAFGLVIDERLLRNAEKAKDELSILSQVIGTDLTNALLQAAPQITELAERIGDAIPRIVGMTGGFLEFIGVLEQLPSARIAELHAEIADLEAQLSEMRAGGFSNFLEGVFGVDPGVLNLQEQIRERRAELNRLLELQRELNRARALSGLDRDGPREKEAPPAADIGVDAEASFKALERVEEARQRLMEEGRQVTEAQRTAAERLVDEQARLQNLLQAGAISWETYNRGVAAAQEEFDEATRAAAETEAKIGELGEEARRVQDAARDLGFTFSSAFEDAIMEGRELSEVLRALERDILRILARKAITEPLADALTQFIGAGFGGLFGSAGGPATATTSYLAHPGIPAFQSGGIVGDPRLVLAHEREGIFTPRQMENADRLFGSLAALAARSPVEVQINDYRSSGAAPEVSRSRGPDGRDVVRVAIRDTVMRGLDRGDFDRALASNFGVRRSGTVR